MWGKSSCLWWLQTKDPGVQSFTSWEIRNVFFKVHTIFISGVSKQMRSSSWRACSRNGKLCCPNQDTFLENLKYIIQILSMLLKYIIQILSILLKSEAYCTHCKNWSVQCFSLTVMSFSSMPWFVQDFNRCYKSTTNEYNTAIVIVDNFTWFRSSTWLSLGSNAVMTCRLPLGLM